MNIRTPLHIALIALLIAVTGCSVEPRTHNSKTVTREQVVAGNQTDPATREPPRPHASPMAPADITTQAPYQQIGQAEPVAPPSPPAPVMPLPPVEAAPMTLRAKSMDTAAKVGFMPAPYPFAPLAVDRENYAHYDDNPVHEVSEQPLSTFSIDVDTGSYTNVRRMLEHGRLPPADAVRAEEFINYFDYGYTPPANRATPFSVTTEMAPAPWNSKRQLLLIGVQGYRVPSAHIPSVNLVFLVDTSGSMNEPDKLPLLKASLKQLVPHLRHQDHVAIVTYAGNAGVALPSTPGDQHARINAAIDAMDARGSTNGGAGIELAYAEAAQHFVKGGVNRVILATDGDFNVGTTGIQALKDMLTDKRRSGIALSTLGFGQGNYNDAMAVQLADAGNGSHHYIDSLVEGRKVLVQEMSTTLLNIAKDVKIQIEFNPAKVREYRLIGYVKRMLKREDFNNDRVDAGDIGAGANVTALYELTLVGSGAARNDPLRYGHQAAARDAGPELAFLRLRYKLPGQSHSRLIERPITRADGNAVASQRLRFAASVAAFAGTLRGGTWLDGYDLDHVAQLARGARGQDPHGYRAGFVQLVELAASLRTPAAPHPTPVAMRR